VLGDIIEFGSKEKEKGNGDAEKEDYNTYRAKVFADDIYKAIQEELLEMESSDVIYRIKKVDDSYSVKGASGNTAYNPTTKDIDINYGAEGDFSTEQGLAHELKHGSQFERVQLAFTKDGKPFKPTYHYQDEFEAFQRQSLFAEPGGKGALTSDAIHKFMKVNYSKLPYTGINKTMNNTTTIEFVENGTPLPDEVDITNGATYKKTNEKLRKLNREPILIFNEKRVF